MNNKNSLCESIIRSIAPYIKKTILEEDARSGGVIDKKTLYKKILENVALHVKKAITESEDSDIKLLTHFEGNEVITVFDEYAIRKFMKGKTVSAYDPRVKRGPSEKEWTMYAVRVTDIKDCSCSYLGWN